MYGYYNLIFDLISLKYTIFNQKYVNKFQKSRLKVILCSTLETSHLKYCNQKQKSRNPPRLLFPTTFIWTDRLHTKFSADFSTKLSIMFTVSEKTIIHFTFSKKTMFLPPSVRLCARKKYFNFNLNLRKINLLKRFHKQNKTWNK